MWKSARTALIVLTAINLLNYIDRFVLAAVQPKIKKDLGLSDAELGLLISAFIWVYTFASPVFGRLGDTRSRKGLIATGVGLWSLATAGAAWATGFRSLFATRAAVGVGEAAYGSISPAFLADTFPKAVRGTVFSIFFAAIPVGAALGYLVGGLASGPESDVQGWRRAFLVAGLPGLLFAGLALLLREPERGASEREEGAAAGASDGDGKRGSGDGAAKEGVIASYLSLLSNRDYVLCVLGYAAYTFAVGGLAFWMPTFLNRVRGVPLQDAATVFGGITVVAGFVGTLGGGWLADRLLARGVRSSYLLVSGVTAALAVPAVWLALTLPGQAGYYGAAFAAELFIFASTGPINSVVVNVVPVAKRATASALCIFSIHILGDAISPPLIGHISDTLRASYEASASASAATSAALLGSFATLGEACSARALGDAVMLVPVATAVGALIWLVGAWLQGGAPEAGASGATSAAQGPQGAASGPGTDAGAAGTGAPASNASTRLEKSSGDVPRPDGTGSA